MVLNQKNEGIYILKNDMKQKRLIFSLLPILSGFFVMGFVDIVGITSDYVQRTFNWSHTVTGFVPFMVFIWFLFLGIPVGNQMNKWGRKKTVVISMVITIVGMMLPLVVYNSVTSFLAFAFLGIGNAILQVSLNPLLNNVLTNKKWLTSSLTAGQVIKALSSLIGPEIVLLAVARFGDDQWYYCFPILGAITLLSALWLIATPIPKEDMQITKKAISYRDTFFLLKDKNILLLFLGIFFIVGVDVGTNFISSKVMVFRYGWSLDQAKFAPQIYFLSRTIGAFLGAFLLSRMDEIKYFKFNMMACVVALLVFAFLPGENLSMIAVGAIGFFASSIFPIIYSLALQVNPGKSNEISGLMITAVAGGGIVTPLMGMATSSIGVLGGILVVLLCVLYLVFCAFSVRKPAYA